jgi:hypothetical protein
MTCRYYNLAGKKYFGKKYRDKIQPHIKYFTKYHKRHGDFWTLDNCSPVDAVLPLLFTLGY